MRLERRRHNIEKSDLDLFKELRWKTPNNSQTSNNRADELQSLKELIDSIDNKTPIFSEQEAGKATVYSPIQDKESMEEETERYEKELEERSSEILSRIEDLLGR